MTAPVALKTRITEDMKAAMRAGDKPRLAAIRLILAAIKQVEVDTRSELNDADILAVLDKMLKQRRESISQYERAHREDLAQIEREEVQIIQAYMPEPLSEADIDALIQAALAETGASSIKDMGQVMGVLRPSFKAVRTSAPSAQGSRHGSADLTDPLRDLSR
jgi:uncharacterized protein